MTTSKVQDRNVTIRHPIVGERSPIMGVERIPIIIAEKESHRPHKELEWDDVYSGLVNYIKYASKQVSQQYNTGSVDTSEDLYQEGQLLLWHCFTVYKQKPYNEFAALFKASLWRKLREIGSKKSFIQVDLEDAYSIGYSDSVVDDMYQEYKLQQVAEMLEDSPIALTIFKEFVNPSTRTLWEAKMDIARKSTLREQQYRVAIPKTIQVKGVYIQRALEIPKVRFNECFKLVKECVSSVYFGGEATDTEVEEVLQRKYA